MEPRKASDVLLELEAKIDVLMSIVRTQDLNIKILSNKINTLIEKSGQLPLPSQPTIPSVRIEAVDTSKQIQIRPEDALPVEQKPEGFRRTSRPETYAGDNAYLKPTMATVQPKFPMQVPKLTNPEVIVPRQNLNFTEVLPSTPQDFPTPSGNNVPVSQRTVDKNGKSIFLADVEIIDLNTKQTMSKVKTNGVGKWAASLPVGEYKVFIRKRESVSKEKIEVIQDIRVDGTKSPFELPMVIIK